MTLRTLVSVRGPYGGEFCGPTLARALLVGLSAANLARSAGILRRAPWFRAKARPSAANTAPEDRR